MRKRNALLSTLTWEDEKKKFEELASENDMTVSEALHRYVVKANKSGKLVK